MQLCRSILLASPYLRLWLFIIGGFIIASVSETIRYHCGFTSDVLEGHDRRDEAPSVFAKQTTSTRKGGWWRYEWRVPLRRATIIWGADRCRGNP